MRATRALTWANLTGAALAVVALGVLALTPAPRDLCADYSNPTPAGMGGIAECCLLYGLLSFFVSIGLTLGVPGEGRKWALRALFTALLVAVVAGGAFFADLARWTCWE